MSGNVFADNIANLTLVDNVVRFDLITAVPTEEEGKLFVRQVESVVTTLPGFLRMHNQMTNVVNDLIAQGIVVREPPAEASPE